MLVLETNDLGRGGSSPSTCFRMTERFKVSDLKSEVVLKSTVSSNLTPHGPLVEFIEVLTIERTLFRAYAVEVGITFSRTKLERGPWV